MDEQNQPGLVELTARIVSAFVSKNTLSANDLPQLISETHAALARVTGSAPPPERDELKPKVPVKRSVMPDQLVCLEDGKKFKSTGRSGACRRTIRWWRRTTRAPARTLPRRWG